MRRIARVVGIILVLAVLAPATAESPSLEQIRAQQLQMRADLAEGSETYAGLSRTERGRVAAGQQRVLTLIEGKQSLEELTPADRMTVFNELEQIRAIVTTASDERMVCEYVKKTGSNMRTRECKSVAQRAREREAARRGIESRSPCGTIGCPQR